MSKETKLAKKEAKAAKKAAKAEKQHATAYASLVKKIEKKNVKLEKKAAKKGEPFVPIPIPAEDEPIKSGNKAGKVVLTILLVLLLWFIIYFIVMWMKYDAPVLVPPITEVSVEEEKTTAEVTRYENQHVITTTPTYSVAECKLVLKQTINDQWMDLGYSEDPSNGTIAYKGKVVKINGADCYVFSCSGKTFAVARNISAIYYQNDSKWSPLTFNNTDIIFGE